MNIEFLKRPMLAAHPSFNPKEVWVLSWSQKQGLLHIERLHDMYRLHIQAFHDDRNLEYIPLAIGDREAIDACAEAIRPKLRERYDAKLSADGSDGPTYDQLP
ncbi:MAG: hypothetical protein WBC18_14720 [Ottowia sp.]|uniref:hypothetical protein n=1 Tax=Ottowia sp. TaxID=1898956 RepID=UPI003C72D600